MCSKPLSPRHVETADTHSLAHELRTPISNLLTQTQEVLEQPRDATTYRDTVARCTPRPRGTAPALC